MSRNKDVVESYIKAFNDHDYDAIGATMADETTFNDVPGGLTAKGRAEVVEYSKGWHAGFSDARITEPEHFDADGTVVFEFVGRGTQSAEFGPGPFPNKGGAFELKGVQVCSLNGAGEITNANLHYDTITMLAQLGHMGSRDRTGDGVDVR